MESKQGDRRGEKSRIRSYRDLIVWQKAMDLVELAYGVSRQFPRGELFGLTAQLNRSIVSVPSNIAEGHDLGLPRGFARHLRIARGSLAEFETQLTIAVRLGFAKRAKAMPAWELAQEVGKMLSALLASIVRSRGKNGK